MRKIASAYKRWTYVSLVLLAVAACKQKSSTSADNPQSQSQPTPTANDATASYSVVPESPLGEEATSSTMEFMVPIPQNAQFGLDNAQTQGTWDWELKLTYTRPNREAYSKTGRADVTNGAIKISATAVPYGEGQLELSLLRQATPQYRGKVDVSINDKTTRADLVLYELNKALPINAVTNGPNRVADPSASPWDKWSNFAQDGWTIEYLP